MSESPNGLKLVSSSSTIVIKLFFTEARLRQRKCNQMPSSNCVTSWRELRGGNVNPIVCDDVTEDVAIDQVLEKFTTTIIE